jgi:hypothetical protein
MLLRTGLDLRQRLHQLILPAFVLQLLTILPMIYQNLLIFHTIPEVVLRFEYLIVTLL